MTHKILVTKFNFHSITGNIQSSNLRTKAAVAHLAAAGDYKMIACKEDIDKHLYNALRIPNMLSVNETEDLLENVSEVMIVGMNVKGEFQEIDIPNFSFDRGCSAKDFIFRLYVIS